MRSCASLSFLLFFITGFVLPGHTAPTDSVSTKAPTIHNSEITNTTDLGDWDDVFFCKQNSKFFLLRGEQLYTASITNLEHPEKVMKLPTAKPAHIVTSASWGDKLWLFLESDESDPFAIEVHSKKVSHFNVPRLKPSKGGSSIQSHIIIEHANAVLLMIAGGAPESWPREGNRPLYFWMNLESGKVILFPVGWDLRYLSADQNIAIFGKVYKKGYRRLEQSVDMRTGTFLAKVPNHDGLGTIPFMWTQTQAVKPLYLHRAKTGSQEYFAGISLNGSAFPIPSLADYGYLSTAKASDGFVGFRLRREGNLSSTPSPFWLMQMKPHQTPKRIANNVTDFALLYKGNCVFTTSDNINPFSSYNTEAIFHTYNNTQWNLLDGVKQLPKLGKHFIGKKYITDTMSVHLTKSIDTNKPVVFCVFTHSRGDMRPFPTTVPFTPTLAWEFWRRAMIVTSTGERYMLPLFHEDKAPSLPDGIMPTHIWLNNSGKIILGKDISQYSAQNTIHKIHLTEISLRLDSP